MKACFQDLMLLVSLRGKHQHLGQECRMQRQSMRRGTASAACTQCRTLILRYLEEQDLPYTVFQPLYLYGEYNGKDCEEWFMDRVLRCRPRRHASWDCPSAAAAAI